MGPKMKICLACMASLVVFVGCGDDGVFQPTFGSLNLQILTEGENLDDGYRLIVTGPDLDVNTESAAEQAFILTVEVNGDYTAELTEIADNCVLDDNPRVYLLEIGRTVRDTMVVSCT